VLWQTSSFIQLQMPLSEKAKGKQRAVALFSNLAGTSSKLAPRADVEQLSRDLVVRFTDSSPDLTVVVEEGDSVKDVKRKVGLLLCLFIVSSVS